MNIKYYSSILFILFFLISSSSSLAITTTTTNSFDKKIDPNDYFYWFCTTYEPHEDMSEKIDIVFTSDIPVDFYIFKDRYLNTKSPDYSKAEYSAPNATYLNFTYTLTDETSYSYVFNNPNNLTATIYCETSEHHGLSTSFSEEQDETFITLLMIIGIMLIILFAVISVIYLVYKMKKQEEIDYRTFFQDRPGHGMNYRTSEQYPPGYQSPPHYHGYPPTQPPSQDLYLRKDSKF
jgi:hypothetical protein